MVVVVETVLSEDDYSRAQSVENDSGNRKRDSDGGSTSTCAAHWGVEA